MACVEETGLATYVVKVLCRLEEAGLATYVVKVLCRLEEAGLATCVGDNGSPLLVKVTARL
jgi:hypothetical protein